MWEVVKRKNGVEYWTKQFAGYEDAFSYYSKAAKSINALREDGTYKLPNLRISIRKT